MDLSIWKNMFIVFIFIVQMSFSFAKDRCQFQCESRTEYYSRFQRNENFLNGIYRLCLKQCKGSSTLGTTPGTLTKKTSPTPIWTTRRTSIIPPSPIYGDSDCGVSDIVSNKIIGGQNAQECEFPWVAGIKIPGNWCGGTIIDAYHILTAAHCMLGKDGKLLKLSDVKVMVGSSYLRKLKLQPLSIAAMDLSEKYNITNKDYDLAMLTLRRSLQFNKCVKPICLPKSNDKPEDTLGCTVAGWGKTYSPTPMDTNREVSPILKKVQVPIVSNDLCSRRFRSYGIADVINDRRLCAGDVVNGGKDSCNGDSGGPLMCQVRSNSVTRYVQYGIVSWGSTRCGAVNSLGVYMRVTHPDILEFVTRFVPL